MPKWKTDSSGAITLGGFHQGVEGYLMPGDVHGPPTQFGAFANAAQLRGVRAIAPKDGTINGLYYWLTSLGTGSQIIGAIYGTNKTTWLRTRLWAGSWFAAATTGAWASFGNPGLTVAKGDWLELCVGCDAAQPSFARMATWASIASPPAPFVQMPPAPAFELGQPDNHVAGAVATGGGDFLTWHKYGNTVTAGSTLPATLAIEEITWASPPVFVVGTYA